MLATLTAGMKNTRRLLSPIKGNSRSQCKSATWKPRKANQFRALEVLPKRLSFNQDLRVNLFISNQALETPDEKNTYWLRGMGP